MRTYYIAQGTLLNALWWTEWEDGPKDRGSTNIWLIHFAVQ